MNNSYHYASCETEFVVVHSTKVNEDFSGYFSRDEFEEIRGFSV